MKSAMQKYLASIKKGIVTKTEIIGIRKAINHVERLARGWSGNRSNATPNEIFEVESALAEIEPWVTNELHTSGLKLLRNKRYVKRFNEAQCLIIDDPAVMFRLVRFDQIGDTGQYAVPVYRVASLTGGAFLFRNIPWQSGGNGPEIVS